MQNISIVRTQTKRFPWTLFSVHTTHNWNIILIHHSIAVMIVLNCSINALFNALFWKWYFSEYLFAGAVCNIASKTAWQNFISIWQPRKKSKYACQLFLAVCTEGMKILYSKVCLQREYKPERSPTPHMHACTVVHVFTACFKHVLQVKLFLWKGSWPREIS